MFWNRSEEEGEDEVDSDFSIEENDEPVSDQDDDEPKKKRRIITKAYKVYWKTDNAYTSSVYNCLNLNNMQQMHGKALLDHLWCEN